MFRNKILLFLTPVSLIVLIIILSAPSLILLWRMNIARLYLVHALLILEETHEIPTGIQNLAESRPNMARYLGQWYFEQNQFAKSQVWLGKSLEGSQSSLAYLSLCGMAFQAGHLAEAQMACAAGDIPADYWVVRGEGYRIAGKYEATLKSYLMAIVLDPDSAAAKSLLGYARGNYQYENSKALVAILEEWLDRQPKLSPEIYIHLGAILQRMGQTEQARQISERGCRYFPEVDDLCLPSP